MDQEPPETWGDIDFEQVLGRLQHLGPQKQAVRVISMYVYVVRMMRLCLLLIMYYVLYTV